MEIKETLTIYLTPDQIREILAGYLNNEGYLLKEKIQFNMSEHLSGGGMFETNVQQFDGISVRGTKL